MKLIIGLIFTATLFSACVKEGRLCCLPPQMSIMGKWVDANKREDTLEIYFEGSKGVLFDNSAYYRNNQAAITDKNSFRMQFQLNGNKIGVKPYAALATVDYNYFDLTWIQEGSKFTMLQNAIRPYISSLPMGTYERVY